MNAASVASLLLTLLAPIELGPSLASANPTLVAVSVSMGTRMKAADDDVSLDIDVHAQPGRVIGSKRGVRDVWYADSTFEMILDDPQHVLRSELATGDITVVLSHPLSHEWIYDCDLTLIFSDSSVTRIGWRAHTMSPAEATTALRWNINECLSLDRARSQQSECAFSVGRRSSR
jgi:hypothetical protein